jgi:hypothetical protein
LPAALLLFVGASFFLMSCPPRPWWNRSVMS